MGDGGALWHVADPAFVKIIQGHFWHENWLWTAGKNGFIIGFTKGGGTYGGLLREGLTVVILLTAAGTDLICYRIKNELIFVGMMTGITLWMTDPPAGGIHLLSGILLPVLVCWIPFRMHALGAGDVKLFSVIGCLNGGRDALCCITFSFLLAAGFSLGRLLSRRRLRSSLFDCFHYFQEIVSSGKIFPYPGRKAPDHRFHFSVFIFLGYLVFLGVNVCKNAPLCWAAWKAGI